MKIRAANTGKHRCFLQLFDFRDSVSSAYPNSMNSAVNCALFGCIAVCFPVVHFSLETPRNSSRKVIPDERVHFLSELYKKISDFVGASIGEKATEFATIATEAITTSPETA